MESKTIKWLRYSLLYIVLWCISPPLSYGAIYRVIALGAVVYILRCHLRINQMKIEKHFALTLFLIIYMLILSLATGDGIERRIPSYILLFVIMSADIFLDEILEKKYFYFIITITFAALVLWNICSLRGIAEVPNIMRLLAKNSGFSEAYARRGVGGFGYIYLIIIMLPIGMDCILNKKGNKLNRLLAGLFVITTYVLVFQSQYLLAMILAVFVLGVYYSMRIQDVKYRIMLLIVLLIGFFVVYSNADRILLFLIEKNEMRSIELKLNDIYDMLVNDGSIENSEFSTRFERYMRDLKYIAQHPILGGFSYNVTGNHSHILDYFAQYGLPVGAAYLSLVYRPFGKLKMKNYTAGYTSIIVFTIIALMNTITYLFSAVLYIIIPLYYYMTKEQEENG